MSLLTYLDSHAAGLASLAALLAVVIGPALQSIAAVKQGRSQAIAAFASQLTKSAIDETAELIGLVTRLYNANTVEIDLIRKQIYEKELKISLIIGTSTIPRTIVVTYLSLIRAGAEKLVSSDEMERLVSELKKGFEDLLREERTAIPNSI